MPHHTSRNVDETISCFKGTGEENYDQSKAILGLASCMSVWTGDSDKEFAVCILVKSSFTIYLSLN